jgi:excisionase family DNA binding protein
MDTLSCYNPTVVIPHPGGVVVRTGEAAFLRVREAAVVLGISNSAAYELANVWLATEGRTGLPAVRMGRRILIPRAAIDQLAAVGSDNGHAVDFAG